MNKFKINSKEYDLSKLKQYTCVTKDVEGKNFVDLVIHLYEPNPEDQFAILTYDMDNIVDSSNLQYILERLSYVIRKGR